MHISKVIDKFNKLFYLQKSYNLALFLRIINKNIYKKEKGITKLINTNIFYKNNNLLMIITRIITIRIITF